MGTCDVDPQRRVPSGSDGRGEGRASRGLQNIMQQFSERTDPTFAPKLLKVKGLTEREREVLMWIMEGKTNGEIGSILGISIHTASKHIEHVFLKLGVHSRIQAFNKVLELFQEQHQGYSLVSNESHLRPEGA